MDKEIEKLFKDIKVVDNDEAKKIYFITTGNIGEYMEHSEDEKLSNDVLISRALLNYNLVDDEPKVEKKIMLLNNVFISLNDVPLDYEKYPFDLYIVSKHRLIEFYISLKDENNIEEETANLIEFYEEHKDNITGILRAYYCNTLMQYADFNYQQNDIKTMFNTLHYALNTIENQNDVDSLCVKSRIYYNLATLYDQMHDTENAITCLNNTIYILNTLDDDNECKQYYVPSVMYELSRIYYDNKKYEDSLKSIIDCMNTCKKFGLESTLPLYGKAFCQYHKFSNNEQVRDNIIDVGTELAEFLEKYPKEKPLIADTKNNVYTILALTYLNKKDKEKSNYYFDKIIDNAQYLSDKTKTESIIKQANDFKNKQ